MISPIEITVVMQGNVRPETLGAIHSVRAVLPGARLVLSTFPQDGTEVWFPLVDDIIVSEDPGALRPYTVSRHATPNNLNRQIVSTQAGLARVTTPYTLKMRTDCVLAADTFVRLFEAVKAADPKRHRLIASSYFTRHPCGISGYLFHVSDWFIFGETGWVRDFWNVELMTADDASWFDSRPHRCGSTPAARRFRARFTPEQHICIAYAAKRGYETPKYLNDRNAFLVADAKRFLVNEFIIDSPKGLGFVLPKYAHLPSSLYQEFDCVSHADWRELFDSLVSQDCYQQTTPNVSSIVKRKTLRWIARRLRHVLSAGGFARRWLHQNWGTHWATRSSADPSSDPSPQTKARNAHMLNIVIPMAGAGSRFAKAGYTDPKPLIPVMDTPMIQLVIENLRPQTPHRFIFICQQAHIDAYGLKSKLTTWAPGCEIIGINGVTEGAACTVLKAKHLIDSDDELMIANSDQYVDVNIDDYLANMEGRGLDGLIMTMTADDPKWSFVGMDRDNLVSMVVEKVVISDEATVGIYNFRHGKTFVRAAEQMIARNLRVNGEFYVAPTYNEQIEQGARVGIYNIGSEANGMYGLGIPDDLDLFKSLPVCTKAVGACAA